MRQATHSTEIDEGLRARLKREVPQVADVGPARAGGPEPVELIRAVLAKGRADGLDDVQLAGAVYAALVSHGFMGEEAQASAVMAEREACAKLAEPKGPRPCDCRSCYCGNPGDTACVTDWDTSSELAAAIRARSSA